MSLPLPDLRRCRIVAAFALVWASVGAVPASPQTPPSGQPAPHRAVLDALLDQLKAARSEQEAASLEIRIQRALLEQGTSAVTLLVARGLRDLAAGANQEALDDFDAVIALQPALAEAWRQRALAKLELGDVRGAIRDIEQSLLREPRNFGAFRTLGSIAERREDWKAAYAAWQKLLDVDPKTPGGADKLKDLKRRAFGDVT